MDQNVPFSLQKYQTLFSEPILIVISLFDVLFFICSYDTRLYGPLGKM